MILLMFLACFSVFSLGNFAWKLNILLYVFEKLVIKFCYNFVSSDGPSEQGACRFEILAERGA